MTNDELDRLAALIAKALEKEVGPAESRGTGQQSRDTWLRPPVRPEPPARGGEPAPWTGAAQSLGDVAPVREPSAPRHRADVREMVAAVRAAAAGKGAPAAPSIRAAESRARKRVRALPITVRVGVSNRHLHLSPEHLEALFGSAPLSTARPLLQPGQFAANETVAVVTAKGRIEGVRVVGPARGHTQLELARSDASSLGIDPPVAASGALDASIGGVVLVGPHGRVELARGVIVAARHLHLAPADADRWGLGDGDRIDVECGAGSRATRFRDVLVRAGPTHATELHLDTDEAGAAGVVTGDSARIVAWRDAAPRRRTLVTERDVVALAGRRERIPGNALLTPSARDRARALGLIDS